MKLFDKINIDNNEYICIQRLSVDRETIYKVCNNNGENVKYVKKIQKLYEIISDESTLKKIKEITDSKTDVIIKTEEK